VLRKHDKVRQPSGILHQLPVGKTTLSFLCKTKLANQKITGMSAPTRQILRAMRCSWRFKCAIQFECGGETLPHGFCDRPHVFVSGSYTARSCKDDTCTRWSQSCAWWLEMSCAFSFCRWKLSPPFDVDLRRDDVRRAQTCGRRQYRC
jgi:hypothetical protein